MALTNVDLYRIDGTVGSVSNISTSALNGGPLAGARNRIINGDMRIDQRNAGASVTIGATAVTYTLDRWAAYCQQASKISIQRSTVAPTGFTNSLLVTSLAATTPSSGDPYSLFHKIEGFNWSDLGFGAASPSAITLSFWVRSSLTGAFGGVLKNNAETYSYPFSYTISAANTWEYKTVTIAGTANGSWPTDNSAAALISFDMGSGTSLKGTAGAWSNSALNAPTGSTNLVGTNGATLYLTGVQLEAGTVATPFERRSYGQELALCQRYFEKRNYTSTSYEPIVNGFTPGSTTSTIMSGIVAFLEKRTAPTITLTAGNTFRINGGNAPDNIATTAAAADIGLYSFRLNLTGGTSRTSGTAGWLSREFTSDCSVSISSEL